MLLSESVLDESEQGEIELGEMLLRPKSDHSEGERLKNDKDIVIKYWWNKNAQINRNYYLIWWLKTKNICEDDSI